MDRNEIIRRLNEQRQKGKADFPSCLVKGRTCTTDKRPTPGANYAYGWHCGMGFGGGINEVLDAVDACSYLHDRGYWKGVPGSVPRVDDDASNHIGYIAAISWIDTYGFNEAKQAQTAVLLSAISFYATYLQGFTAEKLMQYLPDRYAHGNKGAQPELVRELVLSVDGNEGAGRIASLESSITRYLSGLSTLVAGVGEGLAHAGKAMDQTLGALFGPAVCSLSHFDPYDPDDVAPSVTAEGTYKLAARSDGAISGVPAASSLQYIGAFRSEGVGALGPYYNYPKGKAAFDAAASIRLAKVSGGGALQSGEVVHVITQEKAAGEYNHLGAWSTRALYYWKNGGEAQLRWMIQKGDHSIDGTIRQGDRFALRNEHYTGQYLVCDDDGYLTTRRSCSFWSAMA